MYEVVFDLAEEGYRQWWFGAFGIPFIAVGVALRVIGPRLAGGKMSPRFYRVFSLYFLGFAILWTAGAFGATYREYSHLSSALESGEFDVVEGPVRDFVPMPRTGHARESCVVDGQRFEYSDYYVTAGFNNTKSHGGPIDHGLHVRVSHVEGVIIRLEIKR